MWYICISQLGACIICICTCKSCCVNSTNTDLCTVFKNALCTKIFYWFNQTTIRSSNTMSLYICLSAFVFAYININNRFNKYFVCKKLLNFEDFRLNNARKKYIHSSKEIDDLLCLNNFKQFKLFEKERDEN